MVSFQGDEWRVATEAPQSELPLGTCFRALAAALWVFPPNCPEATLPLGCRQPAMKHSRETLSGPWLEDERLLGQATWTPRQPITRETFLPALQGHLRLFLLDPTTPSLPFPRHRPALHPGGPLCFLPFVLQRDTPLAPPGQPRRISLLVAPCPLPLGGCRRRCSPAPKNKHEVNTFCSSMIVSSAYCRGLWHIAHLPPPAHFRYCFSAVGEHADIKSAILTIFQCEVQ